MSRQTIATQHGHMSRAAATCLDALVEPKHTPKHTLSLNAYPTQIQPVVAVAENSDFDGWNLSGKRLGVAST